LEALSFYRASYRMPTDGLVLGDMLLAQKIALETMEREALALANSQHRVHLRLGSQGRIS
jgi:ABC-type iron transport system FetAB permease component